MILLAPALASGSGLSSENMHTNGKLSNPSEDWFTSGQPADLILGPLGFEKSGGPSFLHHPWGVATHGTRLFVTDTRNNRILIWNTIPTRNYQPADVVVGQPDFDTASSGGGRSGLNWPNGIATDGQRLFVADTYNSRVLIWNSIPTSNGQPADIVLGQPDFNTYEAELSPGGPADSLCIPSTVATDGTRLFVADSGHERVLIWNTIPTQSGQPADLVLGLPEFWSEEEWDEAKKEWAREWKESNPRASISPRGVCSDGTRIVTASYGHPGRVSIWNNIPITNGQPADVTLDYVYFGVQPATDGTRLFVPVEDVVLIWNSFPTADNQPPDVVVGRYLCVEEGELRTPEEIPPPRRPTRDRMRGPGSVATDGTRLFVAETFGNSRVLIWNRIPTENGPTPADVVLGQPDFTTDAFISQVGFRSVSGLSCDGRRLVIAESFDMRVLIFDPLPEENCQPADVVVGQPDFTTVGEETKEKGLSPWGVFSDGVRLFVPDEFGNRVLIWNSIPTLNFAQADVVLGQPDFTSTEPGAGRSGLSKPKDVSSDGKRLVVADFRNNRVLIWNTIPTTNNQPADVVVGQPDFTSTKAGDRESRSGMSEPYGVEIDGKRLYVSDFGNGRLLIWNKIPTVNGQPADIVIDCGLPEGIFSDGTHLFVADPNNHQVLIWNSIPTGDGQPADVILGRPPDGIPGRPVRPSHNRDGFTVPVDVAFDGIHLWVSEMKWGDRVVRFSIPKPTAVILKPPTEIRANSMALSWSQSTLGDFARYEVHKSSEPGFTPTNETLLTTITDATTTSYTATDLSPGTLYYFKIRTYDTLGYGDSVQRWATTLSVEAPPEERIGVNLFLVGGIIAAIVAALLITILIKRK